jgi:hypothetical protein
MSLGEAVNRVPYGLHRGRRRAGGHQGFGGWGGAGEREGSQPGSILGSAEKFPQDRVGPLRYWFAWVEVRAYLQCGVGCCHADHAREQPQVVDVAVSAPPMPSWQGHVLVMLP